MVPPAEDRPVEEELPDRIDALDPDAALAHPPEEGPRRVAAAGGVDQHPDVDSRACPLGQRAGEGAADEVGGEVVHLHDDRPPGLPHGLQDGREHRLSVEEELGAVAGHDGRSRPAEVRVLGTGTFGRDAEGGRGRQGAEATAEEGMRSSEGVGAAFFEEHRPPPVPFHDPRTPSDVAGREEMSYSRGCAVGGIRDWSPVGSGVLLRIIQYMPIDLTSSSSPSNPTGLTRYEFAPRS